MRRLLLEGVATENSKRLASNKTARRQCVFTCDAGRESPDVDRLMLAEAFESWLAPSTSRSRCGLFSVHGRARKSPNRAEEGGRLGRTTAAPGGPLAVVRAP